MKEFISSSYKALVTGLCKHLHTFITHSAIKGYWWCFRVSLAQLLWRSIPNDTGFSEELRTFKVKVQVHDNSRNGIKDPLLVLPKGLRKQDCRAVCCWEIDTHISPGGTARFLLMFWRTYSLKQQPTYSAVLLACQPTRLACALVSQVYALLWKSYSLKQEKHAILRLQLQRLPY